MINPAARASSSAFTKASRNSGIKSGLTVSPLLGRALTVPPVTPLACYAASVAPGYVVADFNHRQRA